MKPVVCADCQAELKPGAYDTIYQIEVLGRVTALCSACYRSRKAYLRWEAAQGFPAARARQRRIESALR